MASLLDTIGNTPLLELRRSLPQTISKDVTVYAKAEWLNPGGSVKDRPALRMVRQGRKSGRFRDGMTLIDSTSGNTGIAYAMIGAVEGFGVALVVPENISSERKRILKAYGADIIYSDPLLGSDGARKKADEMAAQSPRRYYFPNQYANEDNWKAHYETTGPEIWEQTGGNITHFIAGLGTSGTVMGTGRYLKEKNPDVKIIALQPEPFHGIEGWKHIGSSMRVPIYNSAGHDEIMTIPTENAYDCAHSLAREEGLLVSASAGGVFYGMLQVIKQLKTGILVMLFADGGDRYLSTQFRQETE